MSDLTEFQKQVIKEGNYIPIRTLRQIVLDCFPAGRQAIRPGQPEQEVRFKGLCFIENTNSYFFMNRDYVQKYAKTQFGSESREEIVEELIPYFKDSMNWIVVVEDKPPLNVITLFDYDKIFNVYQLRK